MATMMNKENNPAPRCPYCDAEMRLEGNEDEERMYWYQCNNPSCGIKSPAYHTKVGAYIEAMSRGQGQNRVLTLDEVFIIACDDYNTEKKTVMYLEYREKYEGYAIVTDLETDGSKILFKFSGIGGRSKQNEKDYGSLWRCWRRKPTKNERENTPWKDEGR